VSDGIQAARVVRDAAWRAGIVGRVTPKTLRQSSATHLMDRGVELPVIAALTGHRSPTETGVYLHVLPIVPAMWRGTSSGYHLMRGGT
jgi:integrase/recombinase XerC